MSHSPNYVIAVSSVSGGGKTTLVKSAANFLKGTTLFFDDYASSHSIHQISRNGSRMGLM